MKETIAKLLDCCKAEKENEFTLLLVDLISDKKTEVLTIVAEIIEMKKEHETMNNVPVSVLIAAAGAFGTTIQAIVLPSKIKSSKRQEPTDARHACMVYFYRNQIILTYKKIGMFLGGRDHATVCHALRKHDEIYKSDIYYTMRYDNFLSLVGVAS